MNSTKLSATICAVTILHLSVLNAASAFAQDPPPELPPPPPPPGAKAADPYLPKSWLVLGPTDRRGRRSFRTDAVFGRYLLDRDAPPPKEGESVTGDLGVAATWTSVPAQADGRLDGKDTQWAYGTVTLPAGGSFIAQLSGAATLWVNGEPVVGDVYSYGFLGAPIVLREGENRLFVSGFLPKVQLKIIPCEPRVRIEPFDSTKPDLIRGEAMRGDASVVVMNTSREPMTGLHIAVDGADNGETFTLPPRWISKRRVPLNIPPLLDEEKRRERETVRLELFRGSNRAADPELVSSTSILLVVRDREFARRATFRSDIDGSVQEFGYLAASDAAAGAESGERSVVLSLHGAGADSYNQARSYSPRSDFAIVAPTNRRAFGFDWQDFGRRDAYEALDAGLALTGTDPRRVYLTGHSMGGHGTWHLAANDPDRFLGIAPSAGWISFDTYGGGRPPSKHAAIWKGADGGSDTLELIRNLAPLPTLVVHGTADDNVPVSEAKRMLELLTAAGGTPASHFQEGAGHWWDGDLAPGADCVDLPAIFDLFRSHPLDETPALAFDWVTVDPAVNAVNRWVRVEQPISYGTPIRITAAWDADARRATLTTSNARWLEVGKPGGSRPNEIVLDGRRFAAAPLSTWFVQGPDGWIEVGSGPPPSRKSAARSGPFKRAFDHQFVFVMPTKGKAEEIEECWVRARYDAQQWWYRANGAVSVVADVVFGEDSARYAGRNVILYGNADSNGAWDRVLGAQCPIGLKRGAVSIGGREWKGEGISAFFVRPRADDDIGLVGVMGDTGARGARIGLLHLVFASGTGYPDFTIWDDRVTTAGDGAVLAAGWFQHDWTLSRDAWFAPSSANK